MSEDKPSLRDTIESWFDNCARTCRTRGDHGTYFAIPTSEMDDSLILLFKTFIKHEFSIEEIKSNSVTTTIVDTCWDKDSNKTMSRSEIVEARQKVAKKWRAVKNKFSGVELATLEESEKTIVLEKFEEKKETTVEKELAPLEIDPREGRANVNTEGYSSVVPDLEFLSELGLDPPEDE